MAHGGGTWLVQNKKLPGYYHNVVSLPRASATLSDRGIAAAPFTLSWGEVGKPFIVERNEFFKNSMEIFGYDYTAPEMWALREIFCHALKVVCYRLGATPAKMPDWTEENEHMTDSHVSATCSYATAKYPGTRGNDLSIRITKDDKGTTLYTDDDEFIVETLLNGSVRDTQYVKAYSELKENAWVKFDKASATLETTALAVELEGGVDGQPTGEDYQDFLAAIEPYSFHALCCPVTDAVTNQVFRQHTISQRDDFGVKFQVVVYKDDAADHEGVINLVSEASHPTIKEGEYGMGINAAVYWVTGAEAACAINKTLTNKEYDGELEIDVSHKQSRLETAIDEGEFIFHDVNGEVRVLEDINTFTEVTDTRGDVFKSNQTIRVIDQISNDIAVLFCTRYLGKVQNDKPGRGALWNDVVYYHRQLEKLRAIEDFTPDIITCELGETKKSVELTTNGLNVINAMSQLYMTTIIK